MTFFHLVVVLAVIAGCAAVAAGRVRGGLPEPTDTLPTVELPPDGLTPKDIDDVRFSVGFRGYRMDEVDQVLDRLSGEIARRDAELAEYRGEAPTEGLGEAGGPAEGSATPSPDEPSSVDGP